jgi:hypothetical protein
VKIPRPNLPPILRPSTKKPPKQPLVPVPDDGDLPRAVAPPEIKKSN